MKRIFVTIPLLVFALAALPPAAQSEDPRDLTGVWVGTLGLMPGGERVGEVVFDLTHEGTKVAGIIHVLMSEYLFSTGSKFPIGEGERPIKTGTIKGGTFAFEAPDTPGSEQTMKGQLIVRGGSMYGPLTDRNNQEYLLTLERE